MKIPADLNLDGLIVLAMLEDEPLNQLLSYIHRHRWDTTIIVNRPVPAELKKQYPTLVEVKSLLVLPRHSVDAIIGGGEPLSPDLKRILTTDGFVL
ncbi:MAG: hypothetical protein FH749_02610 [Firmicutes bacterium]|nr:hypothetical protein [Bacillota bacterium]